MNDYFIIKSIFSPNDKIFASTFSSLINLYENNISNIDIFLIGWVTNGDNKKKIKEYTKKHKKINTRIEFWNENYGKYYLFNKINKYISKKYIMTKNMLYFDHDIIILSFSDMIIISEKLINFEVDDKKIGLLVFNQKGDSRHQIDIYDNMTYINKEKVLYSKNMNIMSIGMGCFCISTECFLLCTPLDNISVYGMDDYNMCLNITKNNYNIIITVDVSIYHPHYYDEKYKNWKNDMVKKIIENNITYDESIKNSMIFFKKL